MNTKNGVCNICGSFHRVVDGLCVYCAISQSLEQEELDARECPIAQENLGGVC